MNALLEKMRPAEQNKLENQTAMSAPAFATPHFATSPITLFSTPLLLASASPARNELFTELAALVAQAGTEGGQISPSVYDTAQILRWWPSDDVSPALQWLLKSQQTDGGWGEPTVPLARDVPTLAALLAIHQYRERLPQDQTKQATSAAVAFLRGQAEQWRGVGEDIPVAVEMNLPRLVEEANQAGFDLPDTPYDVLIAMGNKRRAYLTGRKFPAGSVALYCWEAWGDTPDPDLLDETGGVGHSPSATAWWLHLARNRDDLADARQRAESYLRRAANATASGVPGLLPVVWPIARFEQSFMLHTLLLSGLLHHPMLARVADERAEDLAGAQRPDGWGMSDVFMADGDDTAAAIATLLGTGRKADLGLLRGYAKDNHFQAYAGELQASISVTARAAATLQTQGADMSAARNWIRERQRVDGRWLGDKWNVSWLYNALLALALEAPLEFSDALASATQAICAAQKPDGGWSDGANATAIETAYAVLTLNILCWYRRDTQNVRETRIRGRRWLWENAASSETDAAQTWLSKETYRMLRLDRLVELCALLGD